IRIRGKSFGNTERTCHCLGRTFKQGEKSSVVIGAFSGDSSALSGLSVGDLWVGRLPGCVGEENPVFATRGMRVIAR
ncbi:hypothetical protein, partial [Odoribacter splanchnicus]|uniref:hypothetical protein n=1 Tax=Odoribacter splanchnicus TaxID=28118 RepID=UPI00210C67D4